MKKLLLILFLLGIAACGAIAQGVSQVTVHGYVQYRAYANANSSARLGVERVSLQLGAQITPAANAYVELYHHPWVTDKTLPAPSASLPASATDRLATAEYLRTYLESAYLELQLEKGKLRVGKGRQMNFGLTPNYGNRKLTQYGMVAETFTQDRIQGIQYIYKDGTMDAGATLYTAPRIKTRGIGDAQGYTNTVAHFCERDDTPNGSGQMALSLKIGQVTPSLQWHISGAFSKMLQADANAIATAFGAVTTDRKHRKYGADITYTDGSFLAGMEAYKGEFSFLGITGFRTVLGYQPKGAPRLYVSYATLDNSPTATANPRTWDTTQLMLGYVYPLSKSHWVEVNYEKNTETTGGGAATVDNDILLAEMFFAL